MGLAAAGKILNAVAEAVQQDEGARGLGTGRMPKREQLPREIGLATDARYRVDVVDLRQTQTETFLMKTHCHSPKWNGE